jgi:hypothetical protein
LKTLKAWKAYIHERMGHSRVALSEDPDNDLLKAQLASDRKTTHDYLELISHIELAVNEKIMKPAASSGSVPSQFRVVLDADMNIQGISTSGISESALKIDMLMTAPWNLKMHGNNDEEHAHLVKKGVGTFLIHSLYLSGQERSLERLCLKPLEGSVTFYRDHLKMSYHEPTDTFYYMIEPDDIPDPLKSAVAKILCS